MPRRAVDRAADLERGALKTLVDAALDAQEEGTRSGPPVGAAAGST